MRSGDENDWRSHHKGSCRGGANSSDRYLGSDPNNKDLSVWLTYDSYGLDGRGCSNQNPLIVLDLSSFSACSVRGAQPLLQHPRVLLLGLTYFTVIQTRFWNPPSRLQRY